MAEILAELTDALEFQDESMQFVQQTMDKYGISVSQMGTAWAQQSLDKQAAALVQEFRALEAAGANVEVISDAMSDSINAYVQQAIAAGTTVPSAMHDIIQQLISQGTLLDENGEAYESMKDTGLTFSQTMAQQTQTLIDKIGDLVDAINRGLGNAIRDIPQPVIRGQVHWDVDEVPDRDMPGHARGGVFNRPHAAWIAEGGKSEIVGDVDFMTRALAGAIDRLGSRLNTGGSALTVVVMNEQGERTTLTRQQLVAMNRALAGGQLNIPVSALMARVA